MHAHERANDYHNEWVTLGAHRVLLTCRDSAPGETEREAAWLVARLLDSRVPDMEIGYEGASLAQIFYDDKASLITAFVGTDRPENLETIEKDVESMFEMFWPARAFNCKVEAVSEGNKDSDHYDHSNHISSSMKETF